MTAHDPLCPSKRGRPCEPCDVIARARADERERAEYASACWDGCVQKRAIEADVRERIARQIEERMADDPHFQPWADAMEEAARIARGEQP